MDDKKQYPLAMYNIKFSKNLVVLDQIWYMVYTCQNKL